MLSQNNPVFLFSGRGQWERESSSA